MHQPKPRPYQEILHHRGQIVPPGCTPIDATDEQWRLRLAGEDVRNLKRLCGWEIKRLLGMTESPAEIIAFL